MIDRRDLLRLMGVGGVVFASGLAGAAPKNKKSANDNAEFFFLQLSDTHWGYAGVSNPQADLTLKSAIATINAVRAEPEFIVFTGDVTHTTDDASTRHKRMGEFKAMVSGLKTKTLHLMPGEHDAAKDKGDAFREHFGPTHTAFDHKGVHFITLDNVSDPEGAVGSAQIDWLAADLKKIGRDTRVVVFAHRPLFNLYPEWDWWTKDGAKVIDVLLSHQNVTVFYGHIHQEHHHQTEHMAHHAARSLVFPLPAPGSAPKKAPLAWDAAAPFKGLGYRQVDLGAAPSPDLRLSELPVVKTPV
jgi:hypothetical protein